MNEGLLVVAVFTLSGLAASSSIAGICMLNAVRQQRRLIAAKDIDLQAYIDLIGALKRENAALTRHIEILTGAKT